MIIKIVSWNIWAGKNLPDVLSTLKEIDADIVALQEVSVRKFDDLEHNDAKEIADSLGYNFVYGKAFRTDRHLPVYDLGNAILTKYKIEASRVHILSDLTTYQKNSTTEPRNAVEAVVSVNSEIVRVFSTHLGYSDTLGEGDLQIRQAENLIKVLPSSHALVMGDFNSTPDSPVIQKMNHSQVFTTPDLSTPTWTNLKSDEKSKHRIDYIFSSQDLKTNSFEIKTSTASDHLPLIANVILK